MPSSPPSKPSQPSQPPQPSTTSTSQPPQPPNASMLLRRFGKETVNYYSGNRLNRYSFLRSDAPFLSAAAASPHARFLVLSGLAPLVQDTGRRLALLTLDRLHPLLGGQDPFALGDDRAIERFDSAAPPARPLIVFLGALDDAAEGDAVELPTSEHGPVRTQPYFALDATPRGPWADAATSLLKQLESDRFSIHSSGRPTGLSYESAVLYAQARSVIDWNVRNPFCAGCGRPNLSIEAGYKRICPPTDLEGSSDPRPRPDCPTRRGVSNICFPRSDPTMIAAVVSADGKSILLGRQARHPRGMYSALAGFLESGESVEEAVRREVWEEAGVGVGRVVIHSTQPWPYPSTLMLGAIAQALPGQETIKLNDKELENAQWFPINEVRDALKEASLGNKPAEGNNEKSLWVPPPTAIANQLMAAVVDGFLTGAPKM